RPELLPEIKIDRHARTRLLRGLERVARARGGPVAQRWCDAGDMKPVRAAENTRPVDGAGFHLADGRSRAIVNDGGGPLAGAGFHEIDPNPVTAPEDEIRLDA